MVAPGSGTVIGGVAGAAGGGYVGYRYGGQIRTEIKKWKVSGARVGVKGWECGWSPSWLCMVA
jgi:hypothetical protein